MNKKLKISVLLSTVALLTGCVKDELYNTPHPDKGAVKVVTDWSGLSEDAVRPDSYTVRVGELSQTANAAEIAFKHLLPEGLHTLLVHNTPAGITINGTRAEVNALPDGALTSQPDYLFSAFKEFQTLTDDTVSVQVKMMQSLRSVTLVLRLKAEDEARIAASNATLQGIAYAIDLKTGQADLSGTGKTIKPLFERGSIGLTRATEHPALIAHVRLAGVAAEVKQQLVLTLSLVDGSTQTIETNLSEMLKNFDSSQAPLTLDATLDLPEEPEEPTEPTEPSAGGTITGWEIVDNGNITIH